MRVLEISKQGIGNLFFITLSTSEGKYTVCLKHSDLETIKSLEVYTMSLPPFSKAIKLNEKEYINFGSRLKNSNKKNEFEVELICEGIERLYRADYREEQINKIIK